MASPLSNGAERQSGSLVVVRTVDEVTSETFVRITADESLLLVDYAVGPSLEQMPRVNSARVVPGPLLGYPADSCVVTLMKWRTAGQSDALWERGCVTFDTEIHMIKGRLELGF